MSFGKSFGISIALFIGLSFAFTILIELVNGTIGAFFGTILNLTVLGSALFGPIAMLPGSVWLGLINIFISGPILLGTILLYAGYIVAPLLAAILAGNFADSKGEAFGSWFLTTIIAAVGYMVLLIIGGSFTIALIITIIVLGVINGFFYGCFALLLQSGY